MLRILTYHRVVADTDPTIACRSVVSANPETFARQMRYLAQSGRVVSMERVVDAITTGESLPTNSVLITFDDAYSDFGKHAWPVMKQYELPTTVFVPTTFATSPELGFWWDRLHRAIELAHRPELRLDGLGTLPVRTSEERAKAMKLCSDHVKTLEHHRAMKFVDEACDAMGGVGESPMPRVHTWDELRTLAKEGVTIAAHTRTHPILTRLGASECLEEIAGSHADVRREIGHALPVFCYPNGSADERTVEAVQAAGIVVAFSTNEGANELGKTNPLLLNRTNVSRRTSAMVLAARLTRIGTYIDTYRQQRLAHGAVNKASRA